jgi:hypothetical protein
MDTVKSTKGTPYHINGGWDIKAKALRLQFPLLTNEDVACVGGEEDEMLERVCTRLGRDREEMIGFINKAGTRR